MKLVRAYVCCVSIKLSLSLYLSLSLSLSLYLSLCMPATRVKFIWTLLERKKTSGYFINFPTFPKTVILGF